LPEEYKIRDSYLADSNFDPDLEEYLGINQNSTYLSNSALSSSPYNPEDPNLNRRQFPIAIRLQEEMTRTVINWLESGIIEIAPAGTRFNQPIFPVIDKITHQRVVMDPRPINNLMGDRLLLPSIKQIYGDIGKFKVISELDLKKGFNQFMVHEDSRKYLAFTWNKRQYQCVGAPFGLKPLSSLFHRVIEQLFHDLDYVKIFVDNITIFSASINEHITQIITVIQRLNGANLKLNVPKCHFFHSELKILGHILSREGLSVDPDKVISCRNIPRPTSLKQLQSLLGMFNYLRDYIPRFAELAFPLERLKTSKNIGKDWNHKHQASYDRLCDSLEAAVFIHHPDFDLPLYVATDASDVGIGGILYQIDQGNIRYIRLISRALSHSERSYSAVKKELLAIVFCLRSFHMYIWGNQFTLNTDSRILTYMFTTKEISPLLSGWLETILDYNFTIEHISGIHNILPDALSRMWSENDNYAGNQSYLALIDNSNLHMPDEEQRNIILERAHLLGHFGAKAMVDSVKEQYAIWPGIMREANELVLSCLECQRFAIKKEGFHPLNSLEATYPFDHISIDLAGPFETSHVGNSYILLLVDVATRFTILRTLLNKDALTIAQELFNIFTLVGFPKIIQSDNGTEFVNTVIQNLTLISSIDHRLTLPYHPRANGIAERHIRTMKSSLFKSLEGFVKNWDRFIPAIQYAMNRKIHSVHNSTPYALFFGRPANEFLDYSESNSQPLNDEQLLNRVQFLNSLVYPEIAKRTKDLLSKRKSDFEKSHKIIQHKHYPIGTHILFRDNSVSHNAPSHIPRYSRGVIAGYDKFGTYTVANLDGSILPRGTPPSHIKLFLDRNAPKTYQSTEFKAILNHRLLPGKKIQYRHPFGHNRVG